MIEVEADEPATRLVGGTLRVTSRPAGNVILQSPLGELIVQRADMVDLIELLVRAYNDPRERRGEPKLYLTQSPG